MDRYKPTEEEVARFTEELRLYERSVGRFQYHIPDDELKKALNLIPVECTGTESDPVEVSSYRNLPRVETNRVRGGALRVVNDGIVGRAQKVFVIINKIGFQGWDWLKEFKKKSEKKSGGFMDDVISRAANLCFSLKTRRVQAPVRQVTEHWVVSGRDSSCGQCLCLKIFLQRVRKCGWSSLEKAALRFQWIRLSLPLFCLKDSSVVRVTMQNYPDVKGKIQKILFLGDILISFGDFLYSNKSLPPSGYVEEWWVKDLQSQIKNKFNSDIELAAEAAKVSAGRIKGFIDNPFFDKPIR